MDEFFSDIDGAKKRIWKNMQRKLPDRGIGEYQSVVSNLKRLPILEDRVQRAIMKERLFDLLPERKRRTFIFSKKIWAVSTLSMFLMFLFAPVFQMVPMASASSYNLLEVAQGDVFVNGVPVAKSFFVHEGDVISTSENGLAHVQFVDDSRITLGPNSSVTLERIKRDPKNRAQTEVLVSQEKGRVWVQVLNLISEESYFTLFFPGGQARVDDRASFDVQVNDDVEIDVVRNVIAVDVNGEDSYAGTLGQGAGIIIGDSILIESLQDTGADVWWNYNLAYGDKYERQLDEQYTNASIKRVRILPGNPLYAFKTFREDIQETFTFSDEAKQELVAQHAEARLYEAQALIEQGDFLAAQETLQEYSLKVEEGLIGSDDAVFLARMQETRKSLFVQEVDEGTALIESALGDATISVNSDLSAQSETRMLSASQKLSRVPDLLAAGDYERALEYLTAYQDESRSIFIQLDGLTLDEREKLVSKLLDTKLKDLQLLRVLAADPHLEGVLDADAQILSEMSMMVLSLRERALNRLSDFFKNSDYDIDIQKDVYERLKDSSELNETISQQFTNIEQELGVEEVEGVVSDVQPVESVVDPRLNISHSDESQD